MAYLIRTVNFKEVLEFFDEKHANHLCDTNEFSRTLLTKANGRFNDSWALVGLSRDQVLDIILPHHISEGGSVHLVPTTGSTVRAAVKKIEHTSPDAYQSASPNCWKKISYWMTADFSPVFLSTVPVDSVDYEGLIDYNGHLVHLDGLHRLIAWALTEVHTGSIDVDHKFLAYLAGFHQTHGS